MSKDFQCRSHRRVQGEDMHVIAPLRVSRGYRLGMAYYSETTARSCSTTAVTD
jgi:hypothetical protein